MYAIPSFQASSGLPRGPEEAPSASTAVTTRVARTETGIGAVEAVLYAPVFVSKNESAMGGISFTLSFLARIVCVKTFVRPAILPSARSSGTLKYVLSSL